MSEIALYEAQKKKMQGLCDEHNLTYRFRKDCYPIIFTIKPCTSIDAQMTMLENVEEQGFIDPDASMTWIFVDGALQTKVQGGTFTISKVLRTKVENILMKMITYWQQYFFRDVMERKILTEGQMPVISEAEDDAAATEPVPEEDLPVEQDPMAEAEPFEELVDDTELPDGEEDPEQELTSDDIESEKIKQATAIVRMENKATVPLLQRSMNIGLAEAARLLEALEEAGVVGPYNGSKSREVLPFDAPVGEEG